MSWTSQTSKWSVNLKTTQSHQKNTEYFCWITVTCGYARKQVAVLQIRNAIIYALMGVLLTRTVLWSLTAQFFQEMRQKILQNSLKLTTSERQPTLSQSGQLYLEAGAMALVVSWLWSSFPKKNQKHAVTWLSSGWWMLSNYTWHDESLDGAVRSFGVKALQ